MIIPPHGIHSTVRAVVAAAHPAKPAIEPVESEADTPSVVAERVRPGPQRDSTQVAAWKTQYEAQLSLSPQALQRRSQALKEGGSEMLYRMYPHLFQQDLQGPYQAMAQLLPEKGPTIALCGDCHLGNLGTLRHRNQEVLWTLNDYDQVGKGRPESDLCRAASSLLLLCHERGWGKRTAQDLVEGLTHQYCKSIDAYAEEPAGGVLGIPKADAKEPIQALIKKAEKRTQEEFLSKWAEPAAQGYRFKSSPELHPLEPEQSQRLQKLLAEAALPANVQVLDQCCRWDAGGSSLGLERYYVLAQKSGESLPVVLEIKQVLPCALATADADPKKCDPQLLRDGFEWLSAPKDSWQRVLQGDNGVYLLRERQRARDSLKTESLSEGEAYKLSKELGKVLAQAHANGGHASLVSRWLDGRPDLLSHNLLDFASSYSQQVEQDFQELFRTKK